MKKSLPEVQPLFLCLVLLFFTTCNSSNKNPVKETINAMDLKRGRIVLCGPPDKQLGTVGFKISCPGKIQEDFNFAIALLHSFEYDEAEKTFAKIIDEAPGCAMAYWGVAMCNYHPLWTPPTQAELKKGAKAAAIARSIAPKSERESAYIDAIAAFYNEWDKTNHATRSLYFEKAMESVYTRFPDDREAAIFYALALNGAANPADTTFSKQRKAGRILTALYPNEPYHPGIIHYIIHSYDYPELATLALPAARKYASVAPSSAHARHMPSHIFIRLGLWNEAIQSNLAATEAARCYAENTGIEGHWDEELHGMDYLVYAYLQKAANRLAKEQYDYLETIQEVYPENFKVAYAFAAIPARYILENKLWKEAAVLKEHPAGFPWDKYPWQKGIIYFTRLLGLVNTGNINAAKAELKELNMLHDTLVKQKDPYKAGQLQIQIKAAGAWILFRDGKENEALTLMRAAADMEDNTQKHPVTPGEVIPARELLGDMLLQMHLPDKALEAYEASLKERPNRFNGLYGAGLAAEKNNDLEKAADYYQQLVNMTGNADRQELKAARSFLEKQQYR